MLLHLEIQVIFTDIDPHLACLKVSKTLAWIKVSQSLKQQKRFDQQHPCMTVYKYNHQKVESDSSVFAMRCS